MSDPTNNPGKYDCACTVARNLTGAKGCLLIVLGGQSGDGFSVQAVPELLPVIPDVLRLLADSIEQQAGANPPTDPG